MVQIKNPLYLLLVVVLLAGFLGSTTEWSSSQQDASVNFVDDLSPQSLQDCPFWYYNPFCGGLRGDAILAQDCITLLPRSYLPLISKRTLSVVPTPESAPTPTQTTGPAASPTPDQVARGDNLLVNPSFDQGFSGWNLVNNYWSVSTKKCTPSPNERAAQIDRDGKNLWQGGEEDWLRQDVQASMPHTKVVFSLYEVHHMRSGLAETSIYGSEDGVNWERVWFRPEPDAEYGSGKPNCVAPWPTFTYTIDVGSGYHYYRLEFHFLAVDPNDGWKFTSLDLHLVP
jgi:hypothetical protein